MTTNDRPDPDALLRRLQEEEVRARRGQLRVFFGFAPGVGKTYRMLQVARELHQHQTDVLVGVVETHRRAETAAMLEGLPLLPLRPTEYRGHVLLEFDLDAALARKPALILVDELAHTNVPGSRHKKRWQDVLELLDAGIDVLTTVNVQHVESLNDVVSQITGVQVRETVPDSVLDQADAIELVDIAPEELLSRLQDGKVYIPEQARRAIDHFFQRGNLLALRELALRRTAQHVDEDVQEYRAAHGVQDTWPAGERILVCVGPAPSSGRLIRAAARMAAGLRCPWVAAYVESSAFITSDADRERLEAHLRLTESLGGSVTRLSGVRVGEALLGYARRSNVTRIVIGKPTHSKLRDRLRGSLLDEVVRGSGDIDVHVIRGDGREPAPAERPSARPHASPLAYASAAVVVVVTLGLAQLAQALLSLPDPEMLFLLAVMLTAIWFGRGPSLLAAALSVACYDLFFVPPLYTFDVADRRYVLTFATLFAVGLSLSELAGRLKRQEREAVAREERTAVLYALSRDLASADGVAEIARLAAQHAASVFSGRAAVLQRSAADDGLHVMGAAPPDLQPDARDLGVARWALTHAELAGLGTDTLPGSACVCAPLRAAETAGVLALWPAQRAPLRSEQRAFLDLFGRQVAVALERVRLAAEARSSALRAKAEEMRSSLLSAVSHDLRTPLGSITGAASSLRDDPGLSPATRLELVQSICDEALRLERLVANLLDMTRLDSGAVALKRDWVPLDEIIGSALTRLEERLTDRKIDVQLAADLPLILVDPVLLPQLFVNLLENAAKYTGAGTPIEILARREADSVVIEVQDHGPGLPPGSEERVFDKFYRGSHAGVSGAGLGLPICRGIVEAHGGTIHAHNLSGAGAVFHIVLPIGGEPPQMHEVEGAA